MGLGKSIGIGVAVGATAAVLPFEPLTVMGAGFAVALALRLVRVVRLRNPRLLWSLLVTPFVMLAVVFSAEALPTKFVDGRHLSGLDGGCVSLEQLAESTHAEWDLEPAPEVLQRRVCFPVEEPSMRQVGRALRAQLGVELGYRYCGTGATILFGPHPIGPPYLRLAKQ